MLGSATNIQVPRRAEELPGQRDKRFSRMACCARVKPKEGIFWFLVNTEIKTTFLVCTLGNRAFLLGPPGCHGVTGILERKGGSGKCLFVDMFVSPMQRGRQILHNLGVSCFRDDEGHGWADFLNVLATKLYSPIFFHGLIRNVSRIAVFLETIFR